MPGNIKWRKRTPLVLPNISDETTMKHLDIKILKEMEFG